MVDLNQIVIRLSSNAYPDGIATETVFQNSLLFAQMDARAVAGIHVSWPSPAGTPRPFPRFPGMRIREENCNMVLLAAVTLFSVAIAGGATLLGPPTTSRYGSQIARPAAPSRRPRRRQADHLHQRPAAGPRGRLALCPEHESPRTLASTSRSRAVEPASSDADHLMPCARLRARTVTVLSPRAQKRGSYPQSPLRPLDSTKGV